MESKRINWSSAVGLLLIRVILGVVFTYHGSQKLFGLFDGASLGGFARYLETLNNPYPAVAAVLAGSAEFLGGLALIFGYGMRIMVLPLIGTMGVACLLVHREAFSIQHNGLEYPLTLAVVLTGLALIGPGRITLGRLFPDDIAIDDGVDREPTSVREDRKSSESAKTQVAPASRPRTRDTEPAVASPALERRINDRINSLTRSESATAADSKLPSGSGVIADIKARTDSLLADTETRARSALSDSIIRPRDVTDEIGKAA